MEKLMRVFEDMMVAVTFAEAGEFDEANRIAGNESLLEDTQLVQVAAQRLNQAK